MPVLTRCGYAPENKSGKNITRNDIKIPRKHYEHQESYRHSFDVCASEEMTCFFLVRDVIFSKTSACIQHVHGHVCFCFQSKLQFSDVALQSHGFLDVVYRRSTLEAL